MLVVESTCERNARMSFLLPALLPARDRMDSSTAESSPTSPVLLSQKRRHAGGGGRIRESREERETRHPLHKRRRKASLYKKDN